MKVGKKTENKLHQTTPMCWECNQVAPTSVFCSCDLQNISVMQATEYFIFLSLLLNASLEQLERKTYATCEPLVRWSLCRPIDYDGDQINRSSGFNRISSALQCATFLTVAEI